MMETCKNCLHYSACLINSEYVPSACAAYKDKTDVAPKAEVAREVLKEVRTALLHMVLANAMGETYDIEKRFAEIEKKYTEGE